MARKTPPGVPQVLSITRMGKQGKASLKKVVREHLGADARLFLHEADEVELRAQPHDEGDRPVEARAHRVAFPPSVTRRLKLEAGQWVAYVLREGAVAVKRMEIVARPGARAHVVDVETPNVVTRTAYTNPPTEELVPALKERLAGLRLRRHPLEYLTGRDTYEAWLARQRLGSPAPGDEELRDRLVAERLAGQGDDGSWDGEAVLTARAILDLEALGLGAGASPLLRAARWLLDRAESAANPGMWFLDDALVAKQAEVLAQRADGVRARFRERRSSEMTRVKRANVLFRDPCGPRIMWPNALAVRALIALGMEDSPRVRRTMESLRHAHWCECGYQHGTRDWRDPHPLDADEVASWEEGCLAQYRLSGVNSLDELAGMDLSHVTMVHMIRASAEERDGCAMYPLRMPDHIQACELMTVWGLTETRDPLMRRLAEAHLWRFAGVQDGRTGRFSRPARYVSPYFLLACFAGYEHPAATAVLFRSLPWIVEEQNGDGSWGEGAEVDAATLAVVEALVRLGDDLPLLLARQVKGEGATTSRPTAH